ncbi:peptidase C14, caspase domain-containing protein [Mycena alexandri]|uniref:Peptidase C14, caspase domain-containing protein n=1 Tax=Mycena alexandri TaxID=1745969 RepID=A0AAD6SQ38_9AGAR|nr:peptidase C14, caspase domain-containing protein [Mycena alexandri]
MGQKRALLIGIRKSTGYPKLEAAHGDVYGMRDMLLDVWGYTEAQITVIFDDNVEDHVQPTRANILRAIADFVKDVKEDDHLVFHYAGHSMQVESPRSNSEDDGKDECLVPMDGEENKIVDNELHDCLIKPLPSGSHLVAILDTCHAGSLLHLKHSRCNRVPVPWIWRGNRNNVERRGARMMTLSQPVDPTLHTDNSLPSTHPQRSMISVMTPVASPSSSRTPTAISPPSSRTVVAPPSRTLTISQPASRTPTAIPPPASRTPTAISLPATPTASSPPSRTATAASPPFRRGAGIFFTETDSPRTPTEIFPLSPTTASTSSFPPTTSLTPSPCTTPPPPRSGRGVTCDPPVAYPPSSRTPFPLSPPPRTASKVSHLSGSAAKGLLVRIRAISRVRSPFTGDNEGGSYPGGGTANGPPARSSDSFPPLPNKSPKEGDNWILPEHYPRCESPVGRLQCNGWCRNVDAHSTTIDEDDDVKADVISLASCRDSQQAWEGKGGRLSVSSMLVDIIREDPNQTWRELMLHLSHAAYSLALMQHSNSKYYKGRRKAYIAGIRQYIVRLAHGKRSTPSLAISDVPSDPRSIRRATYPGLTQSTIPRKLNVHAAWLEGRLKDLLGGYDMVDTFQNPELSSPRSDIFSSYQGQYPLVT